MVFCNNKNFPNTTRRFTACGILDNFEISLTVLLPNTTTGRAITYTNTNGKGTKVDLI